MPLTDLALIAGLRAGGADAEHFSADIRVDDDARGLVDRTVARFGSLDVAVNAAGARQLRGALTEQTVEAYAETFDTTVLGTMLSLKHDFASCSPGQRQHHRSRLGREPLGSRQRFPSCHQQERGRWVDEAGRAGVRHIRHTRQRPRRAADAGRRVRGGSR